MVPVRIRQVVILVGGRGTRLGHLTENTPKPLMPIHEDQTFLDLLIADVARQGFQDIVLLAGYHADQIKQRFHRKHIRGARVRVLVEDTPLGTAGALTVAKGYLDQQFYLMNGDSWLFAPMRQLEEKYRSRQASAAMMLRHVDAVSRYGAVQFADGLVKEFHEKQANTDTIPGLINAGIYILDRSILDRINHTPMSIEKDIFPDLAAEGSLTGVVGEGYFIDIGLPTSLKEAREILPQKLARPALLLDRDGTLVRDDGYTHKVECLEWINGAREAIVSANRLGWLVLVITNQGGVGLGLYDRFDVMRFHDAMQNELALSGGHIDDFIYCDVHERATVPLLRHDAHALRKPNPGMIFDLADDWRLTVDKMIMVGDSQKDMEAARQAGIQAILFETGRLDSTIGNNEAAQNLGWSC